MQKVASDSKQKEFIKYIALFQKITPALFKFLVGPQIEEAEWEGCKIFQLKVLQILTEEAAFCKCYVHSILFFVGYFTFFLPWLLFTYIENDRYAWNWYFKRWYVRHNASTCVLEFDVFCMLLCWKIIYIFQKNCWEIYYFYGKMLAKIFIENCNNPVRYSKFNRNNNV